jgi:hypothetical protein
MGASQKACTVTFAESRGKGVHLASIIFALHIVFVLLRWIGDLYVTLNLLLSGDPHVFTQ